MIRCCVLPSQACTYSALSTCTSHALTTLCALTTSHTSCLRATNRRLPPACLTDHGFESCGGQYFSSSADQRGDAGPKVPRSLVERFRALRSNRTIIYDIHEEQQLRQLGQLPGADESCGGSPDAVNGRGDVIDKYGSAPGRTGVLDVEDIVQLLRDEALNDICVISVPEWLAYVHYMVVATGESQRHLLATGQLLRRVFKRRSASAQRRHRQVPSIEGREGSGSGTSGQWLAMDLGNAAVHLMIPALRRQYDLESLWALGSEHDRLTCESIAAEQQAYSSIEEKVQFEDPLGGFVPLDAQDSCDSDLLKEDRESLHEASVR